MAQIKNIKKLAITMYLNGEEIDDIVKACQKSERTVYRYIKAYEEGTLDIDVTEVKRTVTKFKQDEAQSILDILKSNSYASKVAMALESINKERIDEELDKRGLRGVTALIGTLVDKRLKSYTIDLEKENLELKRQLTNNGRQIVFVEDDIVYASDNQSKANDTESIS